MTEHPDWLVFRGRRRKLFSYPLDSYVRTLPARPDFRLRPHQRGYQATWEVRADDTLWLTELVTRPDGDGDEPGIPYLFPGATGPVPAAWARLKLRSPAGEQLRYVHLGYGSRYAQDTFLIVWDGRVVAVEECQGEDAHRVGSECTRHLEAVFGSEEGAFLRAAHAAPDDTAPRLVYADWLDERADPRGGVIRLDERVRGLPPEARARELAAHRDTLHRGLGHRLWAMVMGYDRLMSPAVPA